MLSTVSINYAGNGAPFRIFLRTFCYLHSLFVFSRKIPTIKHKMVLKDIVFAVNLVRSADNTDYTQIRYRNPRHIMVAYHLIFINE